MRNRVGPTARLLLHVLLFPLILIGIAWGLMGYAQSQLAELPSPQEFQAQLRQLGLTKADVTAGLTADAGVPATSQELLDNQTSGKTSRRLLELQEFYQARTSAFAQIGPYSLASMVASALALIVGLFSILMAWLAGRHAMRSREAVISEFSRARTALPWLMASQILCLSAALLLLTVVVGWFGYETMMNGQEARGQAKLELYAIVIGLGASWIGLRGVFGLRRAFDAFQASPLQQWGREIDQTHAPALWQHVRTIADKLGADMPRNMVIGLTDGFYVTAHDVELMPEGRLLKGETLYLPLSYSALMRPDELNSVIGHELGHFSGADTHYSLRFVPLHAGMARSLEALAISSDYSDSFILAPAFLMGDFLMERMQFAVAHWSRQREFAADQQGVRAAGTAALAQALIRSGAIGPVIDDYLGEIARRPEDAPSDLLQGLLDYADKRGLGAPDLDSEAAIAHPTDSHPPTRDRISALGMAVTPELTATACTPASVEGVTFLDTLLPERLSWQRQLSTDIAAVSLENKQAYQAQLHELIAGAEQSLEIRQRVRGVVIALNVTTAMLLLLAVGTAYFGWTLQQEPTAVVLFVAFFVGMAALCWLLRRHWRRHGNHPLVTLSAVGLSSPSLREPLPWSNIADVNATLLNGGHLSVLFTLTADAAAPHLLDTNWRRFKWHPKQRNFEIKTSRLMQHSFDEFLELIAQYRMADFAKTELRAMHEPARL